MMVMRFALGSGKVIINDNASGGTIEVYSGMPYNTFAAAARKAKISFHKMSGEDGVGLDNSFFACALYFKDGKLNEIEN